MLLIQLLLIIIASCIGLRAIILSNKINNTIRLCLLIIIDILLVLSILFKYYFESKLWFFGTIIPIILLIINIFCSITFFVKFKKGYFINILIPILSIILLFSNINICYENTIKLELSKAKNKLEKITGGEQYEMKNVYIENGLYAFKFGCGITDNWTAIIYDDSGTLEKGLEIIEENENYFNLLEYESIKILFGGDIIYIRKLEKNWFLCGFT
jgi:predicted small secreted protein